MRLSFDRLWVVLALALPALIALVVPMAAVDLAYQVRAGAEILAAGALPGVDTWTFTIEGKPWLDQQWLAQVLLAIGHWAGGWELLAVLRAALIVAAVGLLLAACVERGAPIRSAAILSLLAFLLAAPSLALRPQLFGIVLFAGLLWLVAARARRPWLYAAAPVLVALWANVHGSFVLAPLVLGYAWLDDLTAGRPWRASLAVLVVGTAATLVNPFGFGAWTYAASIGLDPVIRETVSEWQRTTPFTIPGALFYVSASAAIVFALGARRHGNVVRWPDLLWLVGWAVVGAWAERGLAWWPFAAAFAIAPILGRAEAMRAGPDAPVRRGPRPNTLNAVVAVVFGLLVVAALPWWRPADPLTGRQGLLSYAPSGLAATLREQPGGTRVYALQTWASWFEWAAPDGRYFLDSRFELFPASVFEVYGAIAAGGDNALTQLDNLEVNVVAVEADAPLADTLRAAAWPILAEDDDGVLFGAPR